MTVTQMLVRICGSILIVLGLLFWTGNALALIPLHILVGVVLVLALWFMAFLAWRAGANIAVLVLADVWGVLMAVLGLTQSGLMVGPSHWVIRVLHLLVGIGAIGLAEGLGSRMQRARSQVLG